MSDNQINVGDILGSLMGNLANTAAPIVLGISRSILSPEFIKSIVKMVPELLNTAINTLSSINLGEIISSLAGAVLPLLMNLLDPLLSFIGPIIETLLDKISPILEFISPLLEMAGPIVEVLGKMLGPVIDALMNALNSILGMLSPARS